VFSTGVEILGQKPKRDIGLSCPRPCEPATVTPEIPNPKPEIPNPKSKVPARVLEKRRWDLAFGIWDLIGLVLKIPLRGTRATGSEAQIQ
jgi:hypothetical protein